MGRIPFVAGSLLMLLVVFLVGAYQHLSYAAANEIYLEARRLLFDASTFYIFQHNFLVCLLMFVPVLGPSVGLYAIYNTGLVYAAAARLIGADVGLVVREGAFGYPHFWLEFSAYSIAIAQSVLLAILIFRKRSPRMEVAPTLIAVGLCAVILFVAAAAEMAVIT